MPNNGLVSYNRTGIGTSPDLSAKMLQGTEEFPPNLAGDESEIARVREDYVKDAEPLGTIPLPAGSELTEAAAKQSRALRPTQLLDKLGERLAFERAGVRLYEAAISKLAAAGGFTNGPSRAELEEIMFEEHEHFRILTQAIVALGGDPTVVTPSADLHATMSKGIMEVMVDPRTTLAQCLEALLVVELADNECWEALSTLAEQAGQKTLAETFEKARDEEAEHLENVRSWVAAAQARPPS